MSEKASICIAHGGDISIPSGPTNRVIAFIKGLKKCGFDVQLVVPNPKYLLPDDLKDVKTYTILFKDRGIINQIARATAISLKAKKIVKRTNGILQIEHSTLAGYANFIGCSKYILDMHDLCFTDPLYVDLLFSNSVQRFIYNIEKRAVKHASKIIVVSNSMKEFIIKEWNIKEGDIEVIPSGYFKSKINRCIDVKHDGNMISRLGSLFVHLDVDNIIHLAKSFRETEIKIYLIGDGNVKNELREKIEKYGIKNVIITGWLPYEEAVSLTAKSVLTFEAVKKSMTTEMASPIKILDCAALGKPMVLSDVSELSKVFKENQAALVSDPRNPDKFIENVHRLLDDEKLRKKLGENAKKVVKDFTWEEQGKKLAKMLEKMI